MLEILFIVPGPARRYFAEKPTTVHFQNDRDERDLALSYAKVCRQSLAFGDGICRGCSFFALPFRYDIAGCKLQPNWDLDVVFELNRWPWA